MQRWDDAAAAAVFDFLNDYLEDLESGSVRALAEYLARYPGQEDAVAGEYLRQRGAPVGDAAEPPAAADASLVGPYRLLSQLGRGGQGTVWLAEDTRIRRRVALKLLAGGFVTEERRERLRREAEGVARLAHPGICAVLEAQVEGERPYIAMQYVEGEDLATSLAQAGDAPRRGARLPWRPADWAELCRVLHFFERAARALHAAHEADLVHRDIKPANVIVTPDGDPVLLDFGLVRDVSERTGEAALTVEGTVFGTPRYMSPEQILGERADVDRRTDVYSLGVTLYEALTGERPFHGDSLYELEQAILLAPLPNPRAANPALTDDVRVVLETAADKDSARRYPTALALAEDLRRIREFEPVSARPAGSWLRLRRWARRQPALAAAVGSTFVLLVAGLAVSLALLAEVRGALRKVLGRHFTARAVELVESDPARALALGIEGLERLPNAHGRSALVAALEACHLERVLDVADAPRFWELDVSARGVVVGALSIEQGDAGGLYAWDLDSGVRLGAWPLPGGPARCLDLHAGGAVAVAGTEEGHVVAVELASGRRLFDLAPGAGEAEGERAVLWVEFAPDGASFVVQLARSGAVRYAFPAARPVTRYATPALAAGQARFSPDGARLLTSSLRQRGTPETASSVVELWDVASGERAARLTGHAEVVRWAEWSADGATVATADAAGVVRLWTGEGDPLGPPLEHGAEVLCATFSPDGARLAVTLAAGETSPVALWDLARGERLDLVGHTADVVHAAWSPDGTRLATTGRDNTVRIWDPGDGSLTRTWQGHMLLVGSRWSPDGRRVLTHSRAFRTFVWSAACLPHAYRLRGHDGPVRWASFTPDGERAITAGDDGFVRVWRTPAKDAPSERATLGEEIAARRVHAGPIRSARMGPRGRWVATLGPEPGVRLWDVERPRGEPTVVLAGSTVRDVELARDGERMAAFGEAGELWLVDLAATPVARAAHCSGPVLRTAFSPCGNWLACATSGGGLDVLDVATGRPCDAFPAPEGVGAAIDVAWLGRGQRLVVLDESGTLHLLPMDGGAARSVSLPKKVQRLEPSPDGERVLAWHDSLPGGRIGLYGLAPGGGPPVGPVVPARGRVASVAIHPSGRWIAAAEERGRVSVWTSDTGELVVERTSEAGVQHVAFGPERDGCRVLTAADDGTVSVWPFDPLDAAKARKPFELDDMEWRREWALATGER